MAVGFSWRDSLAASNGARNVEQWAVNKALHSNEWANFGRKDFQPVVAADKDLVSQFRCDGCQSWLYVTPRAPSPELLRCSCLTVNINLKAKTKQSAASAQRAIRAFVNGTQRRTGFHNPASGAVLTRSAIRQ